MRAVLALMLVLAALNGQTTKKRSRRAAPPKASQPAPPPTAENYELRTFPIATLDVEGNSLYTTKAILAVAGLKTGEMVERERFEAARERLLATGAFDSVGYRYFTASDGESYEAVFQVAEARPVYPARFEDLGVPSAEIENWLKQKDPLYTQKVPPTKTRLENWGKLIQELAAQKGKETVSITAKVEGDSPERLEMVFRPAGGGPVIADVEFVGNKAIPNSELKPAINRVAVGIPFNESRVRQLLKTSVKPIYEARGRLEAEFTRIVVEPAENIKGVYVRVAVDEGEVFRMGQLELQGPPGLPQNQLLEAADTREGDIVNMTQLKDGVERMRLYLRRQGYLMAVVTPEQRPDQAKKVLNVLISIDPGALYAFRSLKIEGLDLEGEPVVRKMWGLEGGKPYNPEYPDRFLKNVEEQGIFDNLGKTAFRESIDEATKSVDVALLFGPAAKTQSILKGETPK